MARDRILFGIVQKNGRGSEWTLTHTLCPSRRGARNLWIGALMWPDSRAEKMFKERLKDGSLRYGKFILSEVPE